MTEISCRRSIEDEEDEEGKLRIRAIDKYIDQKSSNRDDIAHTHTFSEENDSVSEAQSNEESVVQSSHNGLNLSTLHDGDNVTGDKGILIGNENEDEETKLRIQAINESIDQNNSNRDSSSAHSTGEENDEENIGIQIRKDHIPGEITFLYINNDGLEEITENSLERILMGDNEEEGKLRMRKAEKCIDQNSSNRGSSAYADTADEKLQLQLIDY